MLLTGTFEMRKVLLNLSLVRPIREAIAIMKTFELLVLGDIHYRNSFCENVLKIVTP
jgi:hypothetical protein